MASSDESSVLVADAMQFLCSSQKLEREKGLTQIRRFMCDAGKLGLMKQELIKLLTSIESEQTSASNQTPWNMKYGLVTGLGVYLPQDLTFDPCLVTRIYDLCITLMSDEEERVRLAAATFMAVLFKHYSHVLDVDNLRSRLVNSISSNMEKGEDRCRSLSRSDSNSSTSSFVLHECAGWSELETSLKCLQLIVDELCGENWTGPNLLLKDGEYIFAPLIEKACNHSNRFVRETAYCVIASVTNSCNAHAIQVTQLNDMFCPQADIGALLVNGLKDNWSQVRLSSSKATRNILLKAENASVLYSALLGPLCINRYYLAEGVRLYSQETWKLIAGENGTQLVEQYLDSIVPFYLSQIDADNHAVREAACHVIAELAVKLNPECVKVHVPALLKALTQCFKDDSWPVRDAACLASAQFLCAFKQEQHVFMAFLPLFWQQLEDCIASVRQGAAESIALLFNSYEELCMQHLWGKLVEGLAKVKDQPEDDLDTMFSKVSNEPALFGVTQRVRTTDVDNHCDQPMYSCGSLAPKMNKGAGCSASHSFTRPPQPWEITDGCVRLVACFAAQAQPSANSNIIEQVNHKLMPLVINVTQYKHFAQHVSILETFCHAIPVIAKGLGKQKFKGHLQEIIDPLFYSLNNTSDLCSNAAQMAIVFLAKFLGPSIFRGRIEMNNANLLSSYERVINMGI